MGVDNVSWNVLEQSPRTSTLNEGNVFFVGYRGMTGMDLNIVMNMVIYVTMVIFPG